MELKQLLAEAERLQQEQAEAKGKVKELLRQLKRECNCVTVSEAKAVIRDLEDEQAEAEAEYQTALAEFKKEFADVLDVD